MSAYPITRDDGEFERLDVVTKRVRDGNVRRYSDSDKPLPQEFGIGLIWIDDTQYYCDGSSFVPQHMRIGIVSATTYNGDGTIATATIDGDDYVFTYSLGKIATVVVAGATKTFTWSGNELTNIVLT